MSEFLAVELQYADLGLPTFLLAPRSKVPLKDTKGLYDATTNKTVIRQRRERWPDANVAIRTGINCDVIDVDGDEGLANLNALCDAAGGEDTIDGPTVATGKNGGFHVYVKPTGTGNRAAVVPGVDYRGEGGYVVAPPSIHPSGRRYRWFVWGPDEPIRPAPAWFAHLLTQPPTPKVAATCSDRTTSYGRSALERECGRLALAPEGQRNDALNRSAYAIGQLIAGGEVDQVEAVTALALAAERAGLGGREIEATIASGIRSGMRKPRRAAA